MTDTGATRRTLDGYLAALRRRSPLSPADERRLVAAARAGDAAAREALIERFLPAIEAMARQYRADGLDRAELVQEGCVGLLRALVRFDPERGTPFWAYASWWVRQSLQNARSDFLRPFRLPPRALAQLHRLKTAHAGFYARERREPTKNELAHETGLALTQVEALIRADARPRSLEEPVQEAAGEVGMLGDLLDDPLSVDAYEEMLAAIEGAELRGLLSRLSEREREVLEARAGVAGEVEPLARIGKRLGVSAERVRQIEERARTKLRHPA